MTSSNPLLDFSDLPRFDENPRRTYYARARCAARGCRRRHRARVRARYARDLGRGRAACRTRDPAARARMGRGRPFKRSCGYARIARRARRKFAAHHALFARVRQNRALYQKYKAIAESRAFDTFSQARRQVILNALRDFRLAGAELYDSEKPRFAALQERQAALSKEFADDALDATDAYSIRITQEDELAGLPDNARAAARNAAEKAGAAGWRFTLHLPSYLPVLQYAEHRPLREAMYRAYVSRA